MLTIDANDEFGFAEVVTSGIHVNKFRGIPPTGKRIALSSCACFFEEAEIRRESTYADRAGLLRRLGWSSELVPPDGETAA